MSPLPPRDIKIFNSTIYITVINHQSKSNNKDQKKSSVISQSLTPHLETLTNYIDYEWGGFKGSPKFPQFYVFESLLHFYKKTKNQLDT